MSLNSGSVTTSHPVARAVVGATLTASLSILAGMTDAIGFMQTNEFISFMSGNTTRFAIALGSDDTERVLRLGEVLGLFVIGNAMGAIVARLGGKRHVPALMGFVSVLLMLGASMSHLQMTQHTLIAITLAMGALNSAVELVEGVGLGLTYVTGALSKFGRGIGRKLMGDPGWGWAYQAVPWTGLMIGAVLGTVLDDHLGTPALWVPFGVSVSLLLCSLFVPEDWQGSFI